MPQINEYLPEVEAQGPVGGTSPNLEAVSAAGRGMEAFAGSLENTSDVVYRKNEQKEVANAYSLFAKARVDQNKILQDQLSNNTLDADQFKQQYQDFVDKASENFTTAQGRNFFDRQAARLGGSLLSAAAKGQAQVDTRLFIEQNKEDLSHDSSALLLNPSDQNFADVLDKNDEKLQALEVSGEIKSVNVPMYRRLIQETLAQAQIKGIAQAGAAGPERALQLLQNGNFNDYLSADQIVKAETFARHQQSINDAQDKHDEQALKKAEDATTEEILQKSLPLIFNGQMGPKQIMALPIKEHLKEHLLQKQKEFRDEQYKPNHRLQQEIYEKIIAPDGDPNKIQTTDQLLSYRGSNGEKPNINDIKELTRDLDKYSPEGKKLNDDRRATNKVLSAGILTTGMPSIENGFSSKPSAAAYTQLQQANRDLKDMEDQFAKDGKNVRSLHDPGSNDYFATPARMAKYKLSAQELMKQNADQIRVGTSGIATGPAFGQKKDPDAFDPSTDKSIIDWQKRTGRIPK